MVVLVACDDSQLLRVSTERFLPLTTPHSLGSAVYYDGFFPHENIQKAHVVDTCLNDGFVAFPICDDDFYDSHVDGSVDNYHKNLLLGTLLWRRFQQFASG